MRKLLLMFLLALLLVSCVNNWNYPCYVDAINNGAPVQQRSYVLVPSDSSVEPNDLNFLEFANISVRALAAHGYVRTLDSASANVRIDLAYGVSVPSPVTYSEESFNWAGLLDPDAPATQTAIKTAQIYRLHLQLRAYANSSLPKQLPTQLWKINVFSRGPSSDLREAFPYLMAAGYPYLGENTHNSLLVWVPDTSLVVQKLRKND